MQKTVVVVLPVVAITLALGSGCRESSKPRDNNAESAPHALLAAEFPTNDNPSSVLRGAEIDTKVVYKHVIERYFNAYMKADLNGVLASLHPEGPMYPLPAAIQQLRSTASGNALPGGAEVRQIEILEESTTTTQVKIALYMRVDLHKNGHFREETSHPTCELRQYQGRWRLFNAKTD